MVSTVLTILAQHGEGALPSMERLPLRFRLINAFHSPLFYAGKMLWPLDLVPIYPFPAHSDFLDLKYVFARYPRGRCYGSLPIAAQTGQLFAFYCMVILPDRTVSGSGCRPGWQASSSGSLYVSSEYSIFSIGGDGGIVAGGEKFFSN